MKTTIFIAILMMASNAQALSLNNQASSPLLSGLSNKVAQRNQIIDTLQNEILSRIQLKFANTKLSTLEIEAEAKLISAMSELISAETDIMKFEFSLIEKAAFPGR